jgi:hypothetical protein
LAAHDQHKPEPLAFLDQLPYLANSFGQGPLFRPFVMRASILPCFLWFWLAQPACAAEIDNELLEECQYKWATLEQAGSRLEVAYTFTARERPGHPPVVLKKEVLCGDGRILFRADESAIRTKPSDLTQKVIGINSQYAFQMGRKRDLSAFVVTDVGPPSDTLRTRLANELAGGAGVPWSFLKPLTKLVLDPAFQIDQIRREQRNGNPVVVLTAKYSPSTADPATPPMRRIELILDPKTHCSILAFSGELNTGLEISGRIDHTPNEGSFPVPSRYLLVHHDQANGERTYEASFTKWVYRDTVPEEEFHLSALGLPEPAGVEPLPKGTPRYVWFLIAAAVMGLLALVFRSIAKRRVSAGGANS